MTKTCSLLTIRSSFNTRRPSSGLLSSDIRIVWQNTCLLRRCIAVWGIQWRPVGVYSGGLWAYTVEACGRIQWRPVGVFACIYVCQHQRVPMCVNMSVYLSRCVKMSVRCRSLCRSLCRNIPMSLDPHLVWFSRF